MIRIYLTDDHPVVREGVAATLSDEPDFNVVGQGGTAEDLLERAGRLEPHVAVVDQRLPGIDGNEACRRLRAKHPRVRVLMLTSFDHEQAMLRAFGAGANGFAVKQSAPETLRLAVRVVAGGGTFIDPLIAHRLVNMVIRRRQANGPHDLTPTEMEVLAYLPKGLTNRQIGNELGVAVETVKTHVGHVLRKLGATHRSEAATIALREGLL